MPFMTPVSNQILLHASEIAEERSERFDLHARPPDELGLFRFTASLYNHRFHHMKRTSWTIHALSLASGLKTAHARLRERFAHRRFLAFVGLKRHVFTVLV